MDKYITTPITEEKTAELHAGDYVYITGTIYVARDAAHKRMMESCGDRIHTFVELPKRCTKGYDRVNIYVVLSFSTRGRRYSRYPTMCFQVRIRTKPRRSRDPIAPQPTLPPCPEIPSRHKLVLFHLPQLSAAGNNCWPLFLH